jgi:hypothetical protein
MRRGEEQAMSGSTPLQGRHALVTGASSGLGADLARELDRRGASLLRWPGGKTGCGR